jgi:hypothetical protein
VRPHTQLRQGATVNLNTDIELLDNCYRETKELQGEREREGERERKRGSMRLSINVCKTASA